MLWLGSRCTTRGLTQKTNKKAVDQRIVDHLPELENLEIWKAFESSPVYLASLFSFEFDVSHF